MIQEITKFTRILQLNAVVCPSDCHGYYSVYLHLEFVLVSPFDNLGKRIRQH